MMTHEVGVVYESPEGTLFVVVGDEGEHLVNVLVLQDSPGFTKPMAPGSIFPVLVGTAYWEESVPFASLPEGGKVSP